MSPVEITAVRNKPRWRLAYCHACSDGYRGGKAGAEKWATKHIESHHPESETTE